MNTKKLYQILQESTQVYRKGKAVEQKQIGNFGVVEFFEYDHTSKVQANDNFDKVDMAFVDVVVDKSKAEQYRNDLTKILQDYPQPERLAGGPSYIELAPNFEIDQEGAFRLMALGKTLRLWDILSGKTIGMSEQESLELAGFGFLMISGYNINEKLKGGEKK